MFGYHTILGVQVDWVKGVTQGIIKYSAVLVVMDGKGRLPFDTKSLTGCGLVHHSINTGILSTGYSLEKLEHSQNGFSACQVGLGLGARIRGIGTKDMIYISSCAANGLHHITAPGISFL